MIESYIPAELIFPTTSNNLGSNAISFDSGEVRLSSLESLRVRVKALLNNTTRFANDTLQLQELGQNGGALIKEGKNTFLLNWDMLQIEQMSGVQLRKLIGFLKGLIPHAESNVLLIKHGGSAVFWQAKESGGMATRQRLVRATELACRAPDPTDTVKQHELAHLALAQNYPELANFRLWAINRARLTKKEETPPAPLAERPPLMQRWLERFQLGHRHFVTQVSESRENDPLSKEIGLVLSQFSIITELNSMLVEFNLAVPAGSKDFLFYYRIAETLSALKKKLPFDLHSKLYETVVQFFNLIPDFDQHNIARIVMLFGAEVLSKNPTSPRFFDEKQLFGESHMQGVRPNDSELEALIASIREKELQLLNADETGKAAFYTSMKKLSETITPLMIQRLDYLSKRAREIMGAAGLE